MGLRAAILCLTMLAPAYAQTVTATKWVDNWEVKGKGRELLRKINGRWWSQDNREVTPPAKDNFFWVLDSKPGTVQFNHHRPVDLDRAESLHLWMTKPEVEAALGQPNREFGNDEHAFWFYYAANGIELSVRFMGEDGVLGEANSTPVGGKSQPVASIERELNGRSIYTLLAQRATERVNQRSQDRFTNRVAPRALIPRSRIAQPTMTTLALPASDPEPPAPKRTISREALAEVKPGLARQDVIDRLGEPNYRSSISGDEGTRESLTYTLADGEQVVIRMVNGKVTEAGRP
jgi:hypothetical protein